MKSDDKTEQVIFNCKIDPTLRENFKIKTIREQTTMADVVIDAIKKYVENK